MQTLSKLMATTAVCTFMVGTAAAQGLNADVNANLGVSSDTSTSSATESSTGLAIESGTGASVGATTDTEATDTATTTAAVDAGTGAAISAATQSMARGEAVAVLSADGRVLGEVESATQDARGAAELLIRLDQSLEVSANRVTFSGMADVDSEGRVVLPLGEADFMSRIMVQADGSAG